MNFEQKIETIEGELGVMKGEIKQTLVDLREFIMRQGSPFTVGGGGGGGVSQEDIQKMMEKAQASVRAAGGGVSQSDIQQMLQETRVSARQEASEGVREELDALRRENEAQLASMRAEQARLSSQPGSGAGMREELDALKRQSEAQIASLRVEQADQWSATARAAAATTPVPVQQPQAIPIIQQVPIAPAPVPEVPLTPPAARPEPPDAPQVRQIEPTPVEIQPAPASAPAGLSVGPVRLAEETPSRPPPVAVQQAPTDVAPAVQVAAQPAQTAVQGVAVTPQVAALGAAAPAAPAGQVDVGTGLDMAALDANLLTNLMRWVGGVKRRLGQGQLEGFLELYKLTGHLPPMMERLVLHLADLDALPDESSDQIFTLDDLMDSLLQLHAIVYGPGYASRGVFLGLDEPESAEPQSVEDGAHPLADG